MRSKTAWILAAALAAAAAGADARAQGQPAVPAHVSPEVTADSRVTFRIYAPKADAVTVSGDWMTGPGGLALARNAEGIWEGTTGPLAADHYSYVFTVDGVRTVDPRNAAIKQGLRSLDSVVFVPGEAAAFQQTADVPHGDIRQVWYRSSTMGEQRRMHVYTPPGYDASSDRYPVLYLLHGGGDDDTGWSTIGRAGFIVDNLLAAGAAAPLLVVMPNGSLPRPANFPAPTPGAPPTPQALAAAGALQDRFVSELMTDIVPFVEKTYKVNATPARRAIAGLSMGGGQTLRVLALHPDAFAYVGIWSAGVNPAATGSFEQRSAALLKDPARVNAAVRLLSVSVGDSDFALPGTKNMVDIFTRHGITHRLHVSGGGHTWINWRQYLRDYVGTIFK